jgi:KDO2-lipid IV(A) lauroyltransferase
MKEKRQKKKWTLYSFSNKFIFKGIIFFTKFLPLFILRFISFLIASAFYPFLWKLKRALFENFSLYIKDKRKIKKISRKCVFTYTKGVADFWYCALRKYEGFFHFEEKEVKPLFLKGNIILTAHCGNWELGAIYLKVFSVPFVVFAQPEEDPYVEEERKRIRERFGIETYYIDTGESLPFVAKRILQEGKNIIMLGDRAYKNDFIPAKLFGERVAFLKSPYLLSKWIGVPIFPVYFMYYKGKYRGHLFNEISHTLPVEEMASKFARTMEEILWNYPEQWYNFFPYLTYSKNILKINHK